MKTYTQTNMKTYTQTYKKPLTARCAGDGFWGADENLKVTIKGFILNPRNYVTVYHDGPWWVYSDSGFRDAAREFTGIAGLDWTEQGMQEDGKASMEYFNDSYGS